MTPKEKALELFEKLRDNLMWSEDSNEDAKQCALIAVDEVVNLINSKVRDRTHELIPYWQEVKQEIEKL